jgi:hypothetical protein
MKLDQWVKMVRDAELSKHKQIRDFLCTPQEAHIGIRMLPVEEAMRIIGNVLLRR